MNLLNGWTQTKEIQSRAANRGRHREPQVTGVGKVHAVPEGSDQALCGARPILTTRPNWREGLGDWCRACTHNTTAAPTPLR